MKVHPRLPESCGLAITASQISGEQPDWHLHLVGAFHYWILNAHPVALMGYLVALEWSVPSPAFIEGICARAGLPLESFMCSLHHARLDPDHRADMEALLDGLPIQPFHETLLGLGLLHSFQSMASLFRDLAEGPLSPASEFPGAPFTTHLQEAP